MLTMAKIHHPQTPYRYIPYAHAGGVDGEDDQRDAGSGSRGWFTRERRWRLFTGDLGRGGFGIPNGLLVGGGYRSLGFTRRRRVPEFGVYSSEEGDY